MAVVMDHQIAQLGPGHDHHGQIAAGQGQTAAQLTGGKAFGGGDVAGADQRQGAQEDLA